MRRHKPPTPLLPDMRSWRDDVTLGVFVAVTAALGGSAVYRAGLVQDRLGEEAGHEVNVFLQSLASDFWVMGLAAGLAAAALLFGSRPARFLAMFLVLGTLAFATADVLVYEALSYRLDVADVLKFGAEFSAITQFMMVHSGGKWPWIAFGALMLGVALLVGAQASRRALPAGAAAMVGASAVLMFSAHGLADKDFRFVHEATVRNWLANNLDQGVNRPYSRSFVESTRARPQPSAMDCGKGMARRPNVLLLVVESLSAYHSALHGGLGWTPELDRIAQANTWFGDFHANGFTTDHGLIALLTGQPPLPAVGRYASAQAYEGFGSPEGSVPSVLSAAGYTTHFFTTGDLRFLEKGRWCRQIGFGHVEGAEHVSYRGWQRFHFNAAPDEALYDRFFEWLDARTGNTPFFATLLTVSSHAPYLDPSTGARSEEAAIRYADRQFGMFVEDLKRAGFFRDGLLLVTSDHRAMTPLRRAELDAHGNRAVSRVPFVVIGDAGLPKGRVESMAQQVDLVHSLAALVNDEACRPAGRGTFLAGEPVAPAHVIHVRGDRRSWINVYASGGEGIVQIDGDDTGWLGTPVAGGSGILDEINGERIALGQASRDAVNYIIDLRLGRRAQ